MHFIEIVKFLIFLQLYFNVFLFLTILDYEDACPQKVEDKSITYFQIKDTGDNVLELKDSSDLSPLPDRKIEKTFLFSPNEKKDSQFWYWHQLPNSDYGYIGSKLYMKQVLSMKGAFNTIIRLK